eukprot:m.19380 g.19380  ORF g.19380 m.19380 type:complete len:146 (+) comp9944_c0_seq1:138-575(+)
MATAQSDDEVDRLVAELYSEQIPEDRLITVTRLWQVLRVDDAGEPNTAGGDSDRSRTAAAQRFVELKGPDAVHHRLHTMQKGWMEEARLGVTALLDKISHIPTLKPAVTTLDQELDASILRAHDKAHEGHSHGSGHGHGHSHCSH